MQGKQCPHSLLSVQNIAEGPEGPILQDSWIINLIKYEVLREKKEWDIKLNELCFIMLHQCVIAMHGST